MALNKCIKKVVAAVRGPKPSNFTVISPSPREAYESGNYIIAKTDKDFTVRLARDFNSNTRGKNIAVVKTKDEAIKAANAHWQNADLDVDDRKYMQDLMAQGRPDQEIVNRLEQNILKERSEVVQLLESQGVTIAKVENVVSEENLTSSVGVAEPEGPAEPKGKVKVSEERTISTVGDQSRTRLPLGSRNENEAKPSTNDAGSTKPLEFGPTTSTSDTVQTRDSGDAAPLFLTKETAEIAMAKLTEGSEIIARFLKGKTGEIFIDAFTNSFMADLDVINLKGPKTGNKLDLNKPEQLKKQQEILEHEIIHANTIAYLTKHMLEQKDPEVLRDIKYLAKSAAELSNLDMGRLTPETKARVQYILAQSNIEASVAEFLAIMEAESAVSQEIFSELGRKQGLSDSALKRRIEAFIQRVKDYIIGISDSDLQKDLDVDKLAGALARTLEQGLEFREQQYQEARRYGAGVEEDFNYGPKTSEIHFRRKASFDYLNYAVSSMVNSKLERQGKKILGNLHNIMYDRFPLYSDAADKAIGIYDGSPALQQFIHTVTGENVNKLKKANVLAKFAEMNAQRTEIINDQVSKLTALSQDMSEKEKSDLNVFMSQLPLHDYFLAAENVDLSTAESIEAEAELLRKELWRINPRAVRDAEQLIDWNIGILDKATGEMVQTQTGNIYNLDTKGYPSNQGGEFGIKLRKYLALESIVRHGAKKFENLLKNQELFDVIKDNSIANVVSTLKIDGTSNVRDSLVQDYYKEPFQIRAIQQKNFRMYEFGEETGWKVLKAPTKTELGIVYMPTIDSTDIAGAYTDMKLSSTDINVGEHLKRFPGVVETATGHKLLLTKEQKRELGLIEDFTQGLVRSTAHSVVAQESEIIRNSVLQDDTWVEIGQGKSITKLVGVIESDNVDNPWFVKLSEGTEYHKLPKEIRAKYMPVGNRASNVRGFNEKVDLVRKDISHWLLGGSSKSLFENPQLKWAVRILKNLLSSAKIGMVVLNPIKIANDNLSNLTYLGVLGLDPLFIAKNYKEISTDFAEYSDIQRQIFQLKLQLVSRPESTKIQKHLKSLQKRLKANSIGDIGDKGFVNSLGSDLVSRSADTLSGFQADMHKALEYLLTDKAGNKNFVSHFIMEMQKIGYQAEDFFSYLGDIAGKAKSTTLLQQELDQVAERLREIKSEEDIVNYVAQFTTSPSSEAVRFGSAMTDLTDVLAKETLYRYLVQEKNMSPEDARIRVLDSFPDYKENMPLAVKQLSDVGIIMFPSFWLRIQKIIYRMARDKPINLATELMIQEALGTNVNTIFEANVINKSETFGGLLHTPFEAVGMNSIIPSHIFG